MPDIYKELGKIEKGEAWDESDEVVQLEVKKPLKKNHPDNKTETSTLNLKENIR